MHYYYYYDNTQHTLWTPFINNIYKYDCVSELGLYHYDLKRLNKGSFKNFTSLKILILHGDNLKRLSKGIFKHLVNLEKLDLFGFKLKKLDKDFFKHLTNLKWFALRDVKLESLNRHAFKNLTNLEALNLSCNNLEILNKNVFKYSTNLKELYLGNNKLEILDKDIFIHLTNLRELSLGKNKFSSLDKDIFKPLTNLEYLSLEHNKLESLDKNIFRYLTKLKKLNLSYNKLINLDEEFFKNTHLKCLYVKHNKLRNLNKNIFRHLTHLEYFCLKNNKLGDLDKNVFTHLTDLKYLSLSDNKLKSLPSSILNCRHLENIYYGGNEIHYIPPNIQRFLNGLTQKTDKMQIYNDGQNVHNHQIQESIKNSLQNILELPKKINKDSLIQDLISNGVNDQSLGLILGYCEDKSVHTVLNITFEEALLHILSYVNTNLKKNKKEIYNILSQEMRDSECKCFTGRISRLINCLNGFTDLVEVKIPDNMAISNVILVTKNNYKGDNLDELKNIIKKELEEREYDGSKIKEYLEYVEL